MLIKKIAAISVSMAVLFTSAAFASDLYTVYDIAQKTKLSSGITYEKIEKYTSNGWMNINVIRANLNDNYTKVDPVTNKDGVSNRGTLSSMLQSAGAVAGVNGDFFLMGNPTYTYGAVIKGEKLITSPLPYSYGYPTVSRLLNGSIDISLWNPKISFYGPDNTLFEVIVFNKTSSLDWGPTILTSDWNKTSPGYSDNKDIIEIVVINNVVTEVRKNSPSVIIPTDGYIIASRSLATIAQLEESFKPGSSVTLNIELDFAPNEVEWAFGGLNYLVKDGMVNEISGEVLGTNPRTAIGFNADNSEMILVTIDGRNKNYVGVKQTELAQIMIDLGAYNVVNMDGGGSTTMGIDLLMNSNITVANIPSDGTERKIASGVGIFDTSPKSNVVDSIILNPSADRVFNKTEVDLDLIFYNKYGSLIDYDKTKVTYKVSPSTAGTVVNNVFKPKSSEKVTITAFVGEAQGSAQIEVLDKPVALKFNTDNLVLGFGEKYNLGKIIGVDKNGNSAIIPSNYITYTFRNRVGTVTDGIFTAGDTSNTGAITATFGDAVANIQVKVGYRYKTLNRFEDLNNLTLNLYPKESNGNISITKEYVKEGNSALKLDYDFTSMTDQSIAFVEFDADGNGMVLEDKPEAIGMWVYGDGKNHWLRCRVTDAYGTQTKLTFADEVNWTGWKWVIADIPEGIAYPIKLNNIYLAEINETRKDTGTIYIDNLRLLYEPNDKNLGLREETKFPDNLKVSQVVDYLEKLTIIDNNKELVNKDGNIIAGGNIIVNDAVITNGSLSAQNTAMWDNIKNMANYKNKVLVITMNNSIDNIQDQREIKIFKEMLTKASLNNQIFVVWKENAENTYMEDGIRYITYDDSFELGISSKGTSYKN